MTRQGSNSIQVRHYNERVVLDAVRRLGEASKAEIARLAHLTPQAVAGIVDALTHAGYIEPKSRRTGHVGSPSQMYGLAPGGAYSIGIHVGRRSLDCLLIDFRGETRKALSHEYDFPHPGDVLAFLTDDIEKLQSDISGDARSKNVGVGIAVPYFLGGWSDELGFSRHVVEAWTATNLQRSVAQISGLPVHLENDASAAAIAELFYGLGRNETDFLYVSLNTFIGGGLVIGGKLQTGPNGNSAAMGPFPVSASQLSSVARPKGPFEILLRRASIFILMNHLRTNGVKINRARDLDLADSATRKYLLEWQVDAVAALAQALVGVVSVVDLNAIIVDGVLPPGVHISTLDMLRSKFAEVAPEGVIQPKILSGSIGPNAAAVGAAILPLYAMFAPDSDVLIKKQTSDKRALLIGRPGRLTGNDEASQKGDARSWGVLQK